MTKSTSVFLDGLRVIAALLVFATHIVKVLYDNVVWMPGHAMVIVFFVLSGYVIAFSTLNKEFSTKKYVIARLSRLYSVVLPALALTALLHLIGKSINPAFYEVAMQGHMILRFLATGVFLQSIWWRNLVPSDNGPFWSLGYEFWYYAIFGVVVFVRDWKWKIAGILVCFLVVGENVLLLFPIWLLGVAIYIYRDAFSLSRNLAAFGFLVMALATVASVFMLPEFPGKVGEAPLFYSASYLTDWMLGLGLAAAIWFYSRAFATLPGSGMLARGIKWSAGHTFSLYLYHYPCIFFFAAIGLFNPHIWWQAVLEISLILALVIAISEVTESKRGLWKKGLESLWERMIPAPAEVIAGGKKPSTSIG